MTMWNAVVTIAMLVFFGWIAYLMSDKGGRS